MPPVQRHARATGPDYESCWCRGARGPRDGGAHLRHPRRHRRPIGRPSCRSARTHRADGPTPPRRNLANSHSDVSQPQRSPSFPHAQIAALISVFGPLTAAGVNPARDIGPRIVASVTFSAHDLLAYSMPDSQPSLRRAAGSRLGVACLHRLLGVRARPGDRRSSWRRCVPRALPARRFE